MCCRLGAPVPSQQACFSDTGLHPPCFPKPWCCMLAGFLLCFIHAADGRGHESHGCSNCTCLDLLPAVAHARGAWWLEAWPEEAACCFGWCAPEKQVMSGIKTHETMRETGPGCSGNGAMRCWDLLLSCCYAAILGFIFRLYLCLFGWLPCVGTTLHYTLCVSFRSITDLYMQRSRTVLVVHRAGFALRHSTLVCFFIM